jgi:hypothetical protein
VGGFKQIRAPMTRGYIFVFFVLTLAEAAGLLRDPDVGEASNMSSRFAQSLFVSSSLDLAERAL